MDDLFFSRRGGPTAPTALGHPPAMGAPLLLGHGGASLPLRLQSSEDRLKECLWLPGSPGGSSFQSKNSEMELVEVTIIWCFGERNCLLPLGHFFGVPLFQVSFFLGGVGGSFVRCLTLRCQDWSCTWNVFSLVGAQVVTRLPNML